MNIKINNKPLNLMFDTGEFGVVLDNNSPLSSKISPRKLSKKPLIFSINNFRKKERFVRLNNISEHLGESCDGIIGIDFFKEYLLEINYQTSVINLFDLNENKLNDYEKLNTIHHTKDLAFFKRFTVNLKISTNNKGNIAGDFLIDTGSSRNISTINSLNELKLNPKPFKIKLLNSSPHGFNSPTYFKIKEIFLNKTCYKDIIIDNNEDVKFPKESRTKLKGIIGGGFLKKFNLLINYNKSEIYLKNHKKKHLNDYISDGIRIKDYRKTKKKLIIASVINPQKNTLKVGDEILKINDINFKDLDLNRYKLNKKKPGNINNYIIKRDNKIITVKKISKSIINTNT
ncbi:hypothetical protein ACSIGC_08840 [Tenacibaculum sp. ZS6-P6]|uniref:hypothetical protein n=1 Tax=Tenacibaculum sp. ZS6-P6 TaxID=3447503 RepID=UPI003F95936C